jgi:peptidoglycan/xylan/chitin deacetylase (PgdA/CDA1 family)
MVGVDRRTLLKAVAVGALAAMNPPAPANADPGSEDLQGVRVPPPKGILTRLPGDGNRLALTVDDGMDPGVVGAFGTLARDTGTRLTFFVNGANEAWSIHAPLLRPMVDSGQIQMANHTWSHLDLTKLGTDAIADQIQRNKDFLTNTYGVDGTPYLRPPWSLHNANTDRIAAELGYTTITLWSADLGDSLPISEGLFISNANYLFHGGQIVLSHANDPTTVHRYPKLLDIIAHRNLSTVTLNDVFG